MGRGNKWIMSDGISTQAVSMNCYFHFLLSYFDKLCEPEPRLLTQRSCLPQLEDGFMSQCRILGLFRQPDDISATFREISWINFSESTAVKGGKTPSISPSEPAFVIIVKLSQK